MTKLADRIALKGQSRSTFCALPVGKAACKRLSGHHGDCRPSTSSRGTKSPTAKVAAAPAARAAKAASKVTIVPEAHVAKTAKRRVQPVTKRARRPKAAPAISAER